VQLEGIFIFCVSFFGPFWEKRFHSFVGRSRNPADNLKKVTFYSEVSSYPCNHIHGIYGDWVAELLQVAKILNIEAKVFE